MAVVATGNRGRGQNSAVPEFYNGNFRGYLSLLKYTLHESQKLSSYSVKSAWLF